MKAPDVGHRKTSPAEVVKVQWDDKTSGPGRTAHENIDMVSESVFVALQKFLSIY